MTQRVTRSTAVAVAPLPPASPGTPGHFARPDPVAGIPATVPGHEWYEGMQEGHILAFEDSGITADANVHDQMRRHVRRMAGGNVTALTVNTTLTADHAGILPIAIAASRTFTLPAANAANGRPIRFTFVRTDVTAFVATVQRAGTDTIEGLNSFTVPVGGRVSIVSDGVSAWRLVSGLADGRMQVFTGNGTFVVPAGVYRVRASVWGGGGGGGNSGTAPSGGGGGGAGGYASAWLDVTPGQSIAVTVGAAGTAGSGNGGSSSFGAFLTATGGAGGVVGPNGGVGAGGAGGGGTGGTHNVGAQGGVGGSTIGSVGVGGAGGGTFCASGGIGTSSDGGQGLAPGGGGAGGGNGYSGKVGGAGLVMVEW